MNLFFILQVKKGNLCETSPMLNDISGVMSWEKVNSGLLKMYKVMSQYRTLQNSYNSYNKLTGEVLRLSVWGSFQSCNTSCLAQYSHSMRWMKAP